MKKNIKKKKLLKKFQVAGCENSDPTLKHPIDDLYEIIDGLSDDFYKFSDEQEDRLRRVELALAEVITKNCCAGHREEKPVEEYAPPVCDYADGKTCLEPAVVREWFDEDRPVYFYCDKHKTRVRPLRPANTSGVDRGPSVHIDPYDTVPTGGVSNDGSWKDQLEKDLRESKSPAFCPFCNKTVYVRNDKCKYPQNHER
jgi:hypothetical protein